MLLTLSLWIERTNLVAYAPDATEAILGSAPDGTETIPYSRLEPHTIEIHSPLTGTSQQDRLLLVVM